MAWVGTYILDENGNPVPEPDTLTWAIWLEEADDKRIVRQDRVDGVKVSTVFLGLDYGWHSWHRDKAAHVPLLWETMIFGGEHDQYMRRYSSRADAEAGHIEALRLIEPWAKDIAELNRMMALQPEWAHK